jgi:hypothetical protein
MAIALQVRCPQVSDFRQLVHTSESLLWSETCTLTSACKLSSPIVIMFACRPLVEPWPGRSINAPHSCVALADNNYILQFAGKRIQVLRERHHYCARI